MAASKDILGSLHEALAEIMLEEIQFCRTNNIPLSAADKGAIAKFLKDNSITCDPTDAGDLERLRDELQGQREARQTRLKQKLQLVSSDVEALYAAQS